MIAPISLLKNLCNNYKDDIVDGPFGSNLKRSDFVENGIPVLKIQNIKPFGITLKKMDHVTTSKYDELKRHSYKEGDIIMTKLGNPLGASAIVKDIPEGLIVADLVRVRAKKVNTKYLCYHLNSPFTQDIINSQQKGATRPRVRIANVRNLPIYSPPLPEQKQIVTILDQAFAEIDQAKANVERNLVNARELFQSKLNEIFSQRGAGWEEKNLKEVCTIKPPKREVSEMFVGNDMVSFVPMNSLGIDSLNFTPKEDKALEAVYKSYTYFRNNDILLAKITPCFENGKLGIAKNLTNGIGFGSSEFIVYRTNNDLLPEFLYHFLNRSSFREQGEQVMTGAVGHKRIPKQFYEEALISFPRIEKQKTIVQQLNSINTLQAKFTITSTKKLNLLDELKKSILHKAFKGELTCNAITV